MYRSVLYVFCGLLIVLCGLQLYPVKQSTNRESFISLFIDNPNNAELHYGYLEMLLKERRLIEAEQELRFVDLARYHTYLKSTSVNFELLKDEFAGRKSRYETILSEYREWNAKLVEYPAYRDGLYRKAQLEYMLFKPEMARSSLNAAISLDPQFIQAKEVLTHF